MHLAESQEKGKVRDPNQLVAPDFIANKRNSMLCEIKPSWN